MMETTDTESTTKESDERRWSTCSTGSRLPVMKGLPRKGILKRSASAHESAGPLERPVATGSDVTTPLRSEGSRRSRGYTLPKSLSTPEDEEGQTPSRIPKLSVSWWETSSVCGEAPRSSSRHRREGSSDDDDISVTSTTNSINGTWWFGRQTRYVPHCERRHLHGEDERAYLTPTQRKNREVAELRRQLRQAHQLLDDKDKHLSQLRDRLTELENLMDTPGGLPENGKLMMRLKRMEQEHAQEKRLLIADYERTVQSLKRSLDKANIAFPSERERKLKDVKLTPGSAERKERSDSGVSGTDLNSPVSPQPIRARGVTSDPATKSPKTVGPTDAEMTEEDFEFSRISQMEQELNAYKYECAILRNKFAAVEAEADNKGLENKIDDIFSQDSHHQCIRHACLSQKQEMAAQIQAYKKECMVLRTKAAELEISMKQNKAMERLYGSPTRQINQMNNYTSQTNMISEGNEEDIDTYKMACEKLKRRIQDLEGQLISTGAHAVAHQMIDSGIEDSSGAAAKIALLENQLETAFEELKEYGATLKQTEEALTVLERQLALKTTEYDALQVTLHRRREEAEQKEMEVSFLDDRIKVLEKALLDEGLVVPDRPETMQGRRKPSQQGVEGVIIVCRSEEAQTELTREQMNKTASSADAMEQHFGELKTRFDTEKADWDRKLAEMVENLQVKNQLASTLTNRIQTMNEEFEEGRDKMDLERKEYAKRLEEISKEAAKVPALERELQIAREETRVAEKEITDERQKYEEAIECSLVDGIKNQRNAGEYWKEKLAWAQEQIEEFKKQAEKAKKELADTKMRLNLEKVELEQKLEGSYNEMSQMSTRIYVPKENKEVTAKPDLKDKFITCAPKSAAVGTDLKKGDLYDETEECLKSVQGELQTTQRQVEVLQDKLLAAEKDVSEASTEKTEWVHADVLALKKEVAALRAEQEFQKESDMSLQYTDRSEKLCRLESDKIEKLEMEFEELRQEMDTVIKRYESEKSRHVARIKSLEKCERQRNIFREKLKKMSGVEELEAQDFEESVPMETLEAQALLIDNAEQFYGAEEEEPSFSAVVAQPVEALLAAAPSPRMERKKSRTSAATEFLLKRLEKEREGFLAKNEELTERNRELELENAGLVEEVEAGKRQRKQEFNRKFQLQRCASEPKLFCYKAVFTKTPAFPALFSPDNQASAASSATLAANLRAKNLVLIKENRRLFAELARLRATCVQLLEKQGKTGETEKRVLSLENVQATVEFEQPEIMEESSSSLDGNGKGKRVIKSTVKLELPKSSPPKSNGDLAGDLQAVRHDLEGILEQIDEATSYERAEDLEETSDNSREGRLMKWLEKELKKEKEELEVLSMWYEQDKRRLEADISSIKSDRSDLRAKLDRQELELHDVARELEFYRSEDAARIGGIPGFGSSENIGRGKLWRSNSDSDVAMSKGALEKMAMKWKYKAGEMLKDLSRFERDYIEANDERIELREDIVMLNGEIEIIKAQREADKENQRYRLEMVQVDAQAQQTKKDMEAAALKNIVIPNLYENEFRQKFISAVEREGELIVVKRVTGTLEGAALLGKGEASETDRFNSEIAKRQVLDHRLGGIERELTEKKVEISSLRSALKAEKEATEKESQASSNLRQELADFRRKCDYLEEENRLLLADSELDAESSILVESLREQLKTLRDGVEGEKLKERAKYTEQIEKLERELVLRRDTANQFQEIQDILSLSPSDTEDIKVDKTDTNPTDSSTSYQTAQTTAGAPWESNLDRIFDEEEIKSLREQLSVNEERAVRAEQELEMVAMELKLCKEGYARELEGLKMERTELQERLHHSDINRDVEAENTSDSASSETVRLLQEKCDKLRVEMDEKERQHQEMYLTMFKKGQETAKRELAADLDENLSDLGSGDLHDKLHKEFLAKGYVSGQGDLTDDEVVLRFLRDAVYYFLIGKDGKDHLAAIMSILKFSEKQRGDVHKIRGS